jgi:hypothetical protein
VISEKENTRIGRSNRAPTLNAGAIRILCKSQFYERGIKGFRLFELSFVNAPLNANANIG